MPASDYTFGPIIYHHANPWSVWDDLAEMNITRVTAGLAETLTVDFYGVPAFYTTGARFMIPDIREVPAGVTRAFRSRWGVDPAWGLGWPFLPCALVSHTGWSVMLFGSSTVLG